MLNRIIELIDKFGQSMLPKTEAERRNGNITALILAIAAALALLITLIKW